MLYIHGGNKDQVRLSKQLFNFCSNGLFSKTDNPTIDLTIQKVDEALAWTDYEGDGKFFIIDSRISSTPSPVFPEQLIE